MVMRSRYNLRQGLRVLYHPERGDMGAELGWPRSKSYSALESGCSKAHMDGLLLY